MRVLQINAVYGSGSTGKMVEELHKYLKENGIESFVACAKGCDHSQPDQFSIGSSIDMKIHSLYARISGLQGYSSKKATQELIRYIRQCNPDIVHLGNLHSNFVNIKMLFRFLGEEQIATVLTLHDCWFYTGKCSHYTVDNCYKWKTTCGNCPRLKKDIPSWYFDRTRKMLDDKRRSYNGLKKLAVVGVSEWITKEAKQSVLKDANIICTIHNWINLDIFREKKEEAAELKKKLNLNDKYVLLGVAAVWGNIKGLDNFINIAKLLNNDEIIVLVGRVNDVDLPPNIINIPEIKNAEELAVYYSMADLFLQLSPEESFGKVVAEAMACGTPIITIDSTANAELVTSETGFVCQKDNVQEIVDKIRMLKQDNLKKMNINCRKRAVNQFDMYNQLFKYVGLYNSLLEIHNIKT